MVVAGVDTETIEILEKELNKTAAAKAAAMTSGFAPEYALQGRLTFKVDVYSYGVLLLEIISYNNLTLPTDKQLLLQKLKRDSSESLEAEFSRVIQVALVCMNADEKLRPGLSDVPTDIIDRSIDPACMFDKPMDRLIDLFPNFYFSLESVRREKKKTRAPIRPFQMFFVLDDPNAAQRNGILAQKLLQ
ncbi:cold-responsive protein kinase 1-like [Selaginella moellendorffii]|uniref:cold-responsive protein kinase 1-like n=1 Tax=Selaginella moellendorffii TaxID=88036 RepID=UPI000D1C49D9|nr:cold-responsive protein kinase 1-like [Selaginella moellendorffii]|eukprot:XP_024515531.1 cold-responsive protein kinase 1-like [Selaginella moellendorffii]